VIRIEDGIPLFINDYLDRLEHSFAVSGKSLFITRSEAVAEIMRLIGLNGHQSGPVKMIFGAGDNDFFLLYLMKPHLPKPEEYISGVKTILIHAIRHHPNVKIWNPAFRDESVAAMEASGAYEAILVDESNHITEASRSNVFFIKDDHLVTSPSETVLPGITRKKVLDICRSKGIRVKMEQVNVNDLEHYDACFLTGTARKIVPVRCIDSFPFSVVHPMMQSISQGYETLVKEYHGSSPPALSP
jgi:branched-chain amino acid aminotransferase